MKKFKGQCKNCGTSVWMDLVPFDEEPVYEEKRGELVGDIKYDLAIQMLNDKYDKIEDKVEGLPAVFNKIAGEVFNEGYKQGKLAGMAGREKGFSSTGKGSVSKSKTTRRNMGTTRKGK